MLHKVDIHTVFVLTQLPRYLGALLCIIPRDLSSQLIHIVERDDSTYIP